MYVCIGDLTEKYPNRSKVMENDLEQYFSNEEPKSVAEASRNRTDGQTSKSHQNTTRYGSGTMSLFTFSQADAEAGAYCLLSAVIIIQFIILTMMGYCVLRRCPCCEKKRVKLPPESKASVTSPLMSTTKSENPSVNYQSSDTTDRVKCSDSSRHTDKTVNLKELKACLSDDVLAKCLNRRDWVRSARKPGYSREIRNDYDVIRDAMTGQDERNIEEEIRINTIEKESIYETRHQVVDSPNIEMVHHGSNTWTVNRKQSSTGAVSKSRSKVKTVKGSPSDPCLQKERWSDSEREIQCHSYQSPEAYLDRNFRNEKVGSVKAIKSARSIEKGIQAFLPNDSLDNILLTDIQYLEADAISNMSFSSSLENRNCTFSDGSDEGKVVNILSTLHGMNRRDKADSDSTKKTKEEIEILHLSRTSVDSSSAGSESDCLRTYKTVQSRPYL